jgi:hypothetical protein
MATWGTWTFIRFKWPKCVYISSDRGLEIYPACSVVMLLIFPTMQGRHEAKEAEVALRRLLFVTRFRCSVCCRGCPFAPFLPWPYGVYFLDPSRDRQVDRDEESIMTSCWLPGQGVGGSIRSMATAEG